MNLGEFCFSCCPPLSGVVVIVITHLQDDYVIDSAVSGVRVLSHILLYDMYRVH